MEIIESVISVVHSASIISIHQRCQHLL